MELIERGWSIRGAAIDVGVSCTSSNSWPRGYKVYRNGQVVGFVSPLDRLDAREISTWYLANACFLCPSVQRIQEPVREESIQVLTHPAHNIRITHNDTCLKISIGSAFAEVRACD